MKMKNLTWVLLAALVFGLAGCAPQSEEGRTDSKPPASSIPEDEVKAETGDAAKLDLLDFPMSVMTADQKNWKEAKLDITEPEGKKQWVLSYSTTNDDAALIEKFYTTQIQNAIINDGGGFVTQVDGEVSGGHPVMLQVEAPDKQTDPNDMTRVVITIKTR